MDLKHFLCNVSLYCFLHWIIIHLPYPTHVLNIMYSNSLIPDGTPYSKDGMSPKDDICRHDAPMQPRRVTHRCCIDASCRPFRYQSHRVGMMLECSTGGLLARAAFMHHDNQGHDVLRYHAVLKGLKRISLTMITVCHCICNI